jgi:hypothetical protein
MRCEGVAVGPLDGLGGAVVVTGVAHELAGQVPDRDEDSTGSYMSLDPGKPIFDLVEPGGVGRREVRMNFGVGSNKLFHSPGLMRREIVRDQMNRKCCNLKSGDGGGPERNLGAVSGSQIEQPVDETILLANSILLSISGACAYLCGLGCAPPRSRPGTATVRSSST